MASGIQFVADAAGKRSSTAGGIKVWAAAARAVDPQLALSIEREASWRAHYPKYVAALADASAFSAEHAVQIAEAGLAAACDAFEFVRDGKALRLADALASPTRKLYSGRVSGGGDVGMALEVPYAGKALSGEALVSQLQAWVEYGCMEPAAASALSLVATDPAYLDLRGRAFVILGANSALGPLHTLLRCGATVIAVARKRPNNWEALIAAARATAGTLIFPLGVDAAATATDAELAADAGADLLTETPEIVTWLQGLSGSLQMPLTVGMYTYLDSDAHVRVTMACDAVMQALAPRGSGSSLAFIQTNSVPFVIPEEAHGASAAAFEGSWLRLLGYPPNARDAVPTADGEPPRYVHDGTAPLQGPNYALAKTLQMWRAVLARSRDGLIVSANVAPPSRTSSVLAGNKNASKIATAYDGMGHFKPLLTFDAGTVSACMAGLLLHDLINPKAAANPANPMGHPWDMFSLQAFHGGSFRVGVKPSALGTLFYLSGAIVASDPHPGQGD